jgi:hypothetical protein
MSVGLQNSVIRAENLMSAPMDNEIVILNMAKENYVGLDEIGRVIWDLLKEPWRVDELCARLSREFEATAEQIAADVLPFINELTDEGLVRVLD